MSYLTLDADRMVRQAVDAYLEGRFRPEAMGDCIYATRNSQYRVVDGMVLEATDTSLMGADLVGWLIEEHGQSVVELEWRPYARAVFVDRRSRHVVVTSRTLTRQGVGGHQPPKPKMQRKPSVIPNAPPIPVLKATVPPPAAAAAVIAAETAPPSSRRGPAEESTVAADRKSYENLVEESRTPIRLPPPRVPPPRGNKSTLIGTGLRDATGDDVDTAIDHRSPRDED
jgi:hypothetical protein